MHRFYFDPAAQRGGHVELDREESRHAVRVLRLRQGSPVQLFDGLGGVYEGVISSAGERVLVLLGKALAQTRSSRVLEVYQCLLSGDKMDTVVQKCTELGVDRLVPVRSSRCQGKPDGKQLSKKRERWRRVSLAACKQCRRPQPMDIGELTDFESILGSSPVTGVRLMCWEAEQRECLRQVSFPQTAATSRLLLGPEGGFTIAEAELAKELGWRLVSLGGLVLRAETATIAVVAIAQHELGNLCGRTWIENDD